MSIHHENQQAQGDANRSSSEQETSAQTVGPPTPPPQPSPSPPDGKRRQGLIVSMLIIVLIVVLALGSVLVVQFARNPITQATPTPTGAVTPTLAPAGPPAPITTLWMSDASTGWARTLTRLILHTSNGGKNWQDVTPPYPNSMAKLQAAFESLNGTTAWVAVSKQQQPDGTYPTVVFRTSDGGQHWQQVMLPQSHMGVDLIQFVNAQDGWVLSDAGSATGVPAGSQAVDLFRSTDGGQTWSLVASAPGALPLQGIKSGVSWISPTTGWITGSATNTAYLYRTQDGGVSWQPQSLPPGPFPVLATHPPVFFSATEGVLPITISTAQGFGTAIYATHDGGAIWNGPTPPFPPTAASNLDFLTIQQGWAFGDHGTVLYETSDGGQHWTTITTSANFRNVYLLDFVSAHEGWAISVTTATTTVLLKTTDGGQTWVQVP